jgi:hypothetical protein
VEQKISEGTEANVGLVWERWDKFEDHIRSCTQTVNLFEDQQEWTMELVAKRHDTQGADMHLVAYPLKPTTQYVPTDAQHRLVFKFFREYGGASEQQLRDQYSEFCAQECVFTPTCCAWDVKDDAVKFWVEMKPLAREPSVLALRLFHTPRQFCTVRKVLLCPKSYSGQEAFVPFT